MNIISSNGLVRTQYRTVVCCGGLAGGDAGGEGLDALGVAALAQHVVIERVAAAALLLATQQQVAVHTPVAVKVETEKQFNY